MLRLIIIEDEKLIREGLVTYIDWNSLGIEVCMTFANAVDALKVLEEAHPDIIISDIRMPVMDGVEFLKKIKCSNYQCETIFISAYRDFDYAKEAIKYGAFDYLLKPIEEDVLLDSVSRCVTYINEKKGSIYSSLSKEVKQKDLMIYLMSALYGEESWEDIAGKMGVSCDSRATLAIVRTENPDTRSISENDAWDICCTIDIFKEEQLHITLKLVEHEVLIFGIGGQEPSVNNCLKNLSEKIKDMNSHVIIGICSSIKENNPKILYDKASWALFGYCGKVSTFEQLRIYADKFKKTAPKASDFISVIKTTDNYKMNQMLNDFFLSLAGGELIYNTDMVKLEISKLFDGIFQSLRNYPVWAELESMSINESFRKSISSQKSIFSIFTVSLNILGDLMKLINSQQYSSTSRIINSAINIIQKDLSSDISLENVARQLFINPNYLSRIFSSEMCESFSHFRAKMRIEHAKELLRGTKYKVHEIAALVGYSDGAHFAKVFNSFEEISPSEYRDKNTTP